MMNAVENDIPIMSEEDVNRLAAAQIKAEIKGETAVALKLKKELDAVREIIEKKGFAKRQVDMSLTTIHSKDQKIASYKRKKSNKNFEDYKYLLKQMCDDTDFELGNVPKKLCQKLAADWSKEKDIGKAMHQHRKLSAALEKCEYCLDQPRMKKDLIVDIGEQVYLCLPNFKTLTEDHILIVPKSHASSLLCLEGNELKEVETFKSQLRRLFRRQKKSVIFIETSMDFHRWPHAIVECIPVPEEEGDMAPFYFKKAIQECEAEWADNKKLINLKKGLQHSVPKCLPYFHVEFNPKVHPGFAHVIEDQKCFPKNFGKEVLGGMLNMNYYDLYKNKKENHMKTNEVTKLKKLWEKFKNGDY